MGFCLDNNTKSNGPSCLSGPGSEFNAGSTKLQPASINGHPLSSPASLYPSPSGNPSAFIYGPEMGKAKQRYLLVTPANKDSTCSDLDFDGGDSWVMVKKQRITILVPPLPHASKSIVSKPGPGKLEAMPMKTVNNKTAVPVETCARIPSVDEQEKVASMAPNRSIAKLPKLPRLNVTFEPGNPDQVKTLKTQNVLRVSNTSETTKRPRLLHGPGSLLDGSMLLNKRLRASLLEKKLQKAGGLSRWLASLGLGQFVRIFRGRVSTSFSW